MAKSYFSGVLAGKATSKTLAVLAVLMMLVGALLILDARPAYAAEFTVNSTADPGNGTCDPTECTLREAINVANTTTGLDTIKFSIPGSGVQTISPASALPNITDAVTLDGYTQGDAHPNTLEQGNNAVLRIELNGTNAGTATEPSASGLTITGANSTIRGLIINRYDPSSSGSGCACGIVISGGDGNKVEGNFIGTDASGTQDLGNTQHGVWVASAANDNIIGGTTPEARNVISGNNDDGVKIQSNVTRNQVRGNYIGTDKNGTQDLGNGDYGVHILFASDNLVGGTGPGARNVISGNDDWGVTISGGDGNKVEGNFIGTDASGTNNVGNGASGVNIDGATNTVGGTEAGAGNTIAFNGNGLSGGFPNFGNDGVRVVSGTGNAILSNSIFSNAGLGIDLAPDGVTPNDDDDPDIGPNNLQNFPILASAQRGSLAVSGSLNSTPNTTFRIEFFANEACDSSGNGEGRTFVGSTEVTTDGNGDATFDETFSTNPSGQFVAATATNLTTNDTSEFSRCQAINDPPVANDDAATTDEDTPVDINVLNNDSDSDGDALSVDSFTQPSNGTVTRNPDGTLRYVPNADFSGTDSFTYRARDNSGALSNVATVRITVASASVAPVADLSIEQSARPKSVTVGKKLAYTLNVQNGGPHAATGAVIRVRLPRGVTFVSASAGCNKSGGTVSCKVGTMAGGTSVTKKIVVRVKKAGKLRSTATVTSAVNDPKLANNSDTETTTVKADKGGNGGNNGGGGGKGGNNGGGGGKGGGGNGGGGKHDPCSKGAKGGKANTGGKHPDARGGSCRGRG